MAKTPTSGGISLGDLIWNIRSDTDGLVNGVKKSEQGVKKLEQNMIKASRQIGVAFTAAGVAIAAVMGKGVKDGIAFQDGMKKVATLGVQDLHALSEGLKKVSIETGEELVDLTKTLYDTISAGIPEDAAILVIEKAFTGAAAGAGKLASALDAGTSIMNAYGLKGKTAVETTSNFEEIMGQLAVAIKFGKTNMDDIGGAVGKAAGLMFEAGVSTEEYLASIAALTSTGIGASEAVTALKAAVNTVIKPTKEAAELAKTLGLNFHGAALAEEGAIPFFNNMVKVIREKNDALVASRDAIKGTIEDLEAEKLKIKDLIDSIEREGKARGANKKKLEELKQALKDNSVVLARAKKDFEGLKLVGDNVAGTLTKMIGSSEGAIAVMGLTGSLSEIVANALNGMADAVETVNKMSDAYKEKNIALELRKLSALIRVLVIDFADALLPVLTSVLDILQPILLSFRQWMKDNPKMATTLALVTAAIGSLMLVLGPLLIALPGIIAFITTIVPLLPGLATLLISLGAAFGTAFAPVIAFVAATGAAFLFFSWVNDMIKSVPILRDIMESYNDVLVKVFDTLVKLSKFGLLGLAFGGKEEGAIVGSRDLIASQLAAHLAANPDLAIPTQRPTPASSSVGGGVTLNVSVPGMSVRSESDIHAIARQLGNMIEKKLRNRGRSFSIA